MVFPSVYKTYNPTSLIFIHTSPPPRVLFFHHKFLFSISKSALNYLQHQGSAPQRSSDQG
ncbi:hypothetical protein HanPI659440_Chr11g0434411 [Helianthus annuus]|nr:hypothetical protein HanPI659440_Chr11g0434411 [Helianthus annuus]